MGDINVHKRGVKFSKDRQPSKAGVKKRVAKSNATKKRKRELIDLLNISLKGKIGKQINAVLFDGLGIKATNLEEAVHFVQISKAIGEKDTDAYKALMQVAGLNKAIKTDITTNGKDITAPAPIVFIDVDKLSDKQLEEYLKQQDGMANDQST